MALLILQVDVPAVLCGGAERDRVENDDRGRIVRYGDAVPGIVHPSDLETIRQRLGLSRFSIIAAVRLGAVEGREVVLVEPLSDEMLERVANRCEAGGYCPDPLGFVAARVRIVLLRGRTVVSLLLAGESVRGEVGRLLDLEAMGVEGRIVGWGGKVEGAEGHLALSLTPIVASPDGDVTARVEVPINIRWNERAERFQFYNCVGGEADEISCRFEVELRD